MKAQIVSFRCVLRNKVGKLISSTFNRDVLTATEIGEGALPALAEALQDLRQGEKRRICLSAEEAYGFYDPSLCFEMARTQLSRGAELKVGDCVHTESPEGKRSMYRVTEASARKVTLDGNHPLAGEDLIFEIETLEARDATAEELAESAPPVVVDRWLH